MCSKNGVIEMLGHALFVSITRHEAVNSAKFGVKPTILKQIIGKMTEITGSVREIIGSVREIIGSVRQLFVFF